jgi:hypothetical protein
MVCLLGLEEYDNELLGSLKYGTYLDWKSSISDLIHIVQIHSRKACWIQNKPHILQ